MSTPDQPLTRRQLRELRSTGAIPLVDLPESGDAAAAPAEAETPAPAPAEAAETDASPVTEAFTTDASPAPAREPGERRLTRREMRDRAAAAPATEAVPAAEAEPVEERSPFAPPVEEAPTDGADDSESVVAEAEVEASVADETSEEDAAGEAAEDDAAEEEPVVGPQFGAGLLAGTERVVAAPLPPSFDDIVASAPSTSSTSVPSALILSQTPQLPSLSGPLSGTGEVLITGTMHLPHGLGSAGLDPRHTDGKDVDLSLVDQEIPASSSPTPIAASAAISTIRGGDEVIQPPAPEKSGRLVLALAITAGVLAVVVIGGLVVALATGAIG